MFKGDIVLLPFPFTDLSGSKRRPAVVLYTDSLDIVVCFISTQLHRKDKFDLELGKSKLNGLKKVSILKLAKIATIDKKLVLGKLGELTTDEIYLLNSNLKTLLELDLERI